MTCQEFGAIIDGEPGDDERRLLESHTVACAACRDLADAVRDIAVRLHALPRALAPGHDLWSAIDRSLTSRSAMSPRVRAWPRPVAWLALAAGIALAFVLANRPNVLAPPSFADRDLAELRAAEADYAESARRLSEAFARVRDRLPDDTRAVLEKNIAIIEDAIAETRFALVSEPRNREVARLLTDMQLQRVELLRRAAWLATEKGKS